LFQKADGATWKIGRVGSACARVVAAATLAMARWIASLGPAGAAIARHEMTAIELASVVRIACREGSLTVLPAAVRSDVMTRTLPFRPSTGKGVPEKGSVNSNVVLTGGMGDGGVSRLAFRWIAARWGMEVRTAPAPRF